MKKTGEKLGLANCVKCSLGLHIWLTFTATAYGVEHFLQSSFLLAMMTRQRFFLATLFASGACFALYSGRDNDLKHFCIFVVPYTVGTILPSEGNVSRIIVTRQGGENATTRKISGISKCTFRLPQRARLDGGRALYGVI
ncbi:unnamed protein product [Ectocarpus sp. 8 AP-2014]